MAALFFQGLDPCLGSLDILFGLGRGIFEKGLIGLQRLFLPAGLVQKEGGWGWGEGGVILEIAALTGFATPTPALPLKGEELKEGTAFML